MVKVLLVDPLFDGRGQRVLWGEEDGGEDPFLSIDACREGTMRLGESLTLGESLRMTGAGRSTAG
jgi:hypothetical protein